MTEDKNQDLWRKTFLDEASDDEKDALSDILLQNEPVGQSPAELLAASQLPEPLILNCNQATMECLRGPCVYMWSWTQQTHSMQGDPVMIKYTSTCRRHQDLQSLGDDRVFSCDQWWPLFLAFVPEWARALLREKLREIFDVFLKHVKKLDFSWKWWPYNFWQLDANTRADLSEAERKRLNAISKAGGKNA